jgi:hypothetical protein
MQADGITIGYSSLSALVRLDVQFSTLVVNLLAQGSALLPCVTKTTSQKNSPVQFFSFGYLSGLLHIFSMRRTLWTRNVSALQKGNWQMENTLNDKLG